MNKGVQILLERMESNPDEFRLNDVLTASKWANIIISIRARMQKMASKSTELNTVDELSFLTDEEVLVLDAKLKDIRRDAFTQDIMAKLLSDADDGNYHASAQYQSNTPKNIYTSQYQINAMKSMLQDQQAQAQIQAQQEMMLTQANLADAIQNINTKRAFGKGK